MRFEVSPYAVRDVKIYYSEQENVTFFFWKIKYEALLDNVSFEALGTDGDYAPIDLSTTLFPTDAFQCGLHWCFQYQQEGEYEVIENEPPIRSVHTDQGVFAGSQPLVEKTFRTFGTQPVGIDNNEGIDPHLFDWFDENGIVLKRDFEWQFREARSEDCGEATREWEAIAGDIDSDHDWVEGEHHACFALRPKRSDRQGAEVIVRLAPSAETIFDKQRYDVPTQNAHAVYGILLDLEIPNEQRCEQVKSWLESTVESAIAANSDTHKNLGLYTPLSTEDGEPLSGCEQRTQQDLPLAQMVQDASSELAGSENPVRVIWIYVNNINQAPANRVLSQIAAFQQTLASGFFETYNLAIGSDFILKVFNEGGVIPIPGDEDDDAEQFLENPFSDGIGWRPIEDQTFAADIRSWAKANLPFKTMLHDDRTEIPINKWVEATDALRFKICQTTPFAVERIGVVSPILRYTIESQGSLAWPQVENPFFSVLIEEQELLPKKLYTRQRVDSVIEVCLRFCDSRFQTKTRDIYENWAETTGARAMEVCQWTE